MKDRDMTDMHQALQSFLQPAELEATLFPPESRYHGIPIQTTTQPDGKEVAYLSRRFLPQQTEFETLQEYSVKQGDRIDNVAHQFLGDPEQFWRICDANNELDSQQLTAETGRKVRITLPRGIPGAQERA